MDKKKYEFKKVKISNGQLIYKLFNETRIVSFRGNTNKLIYLINKEIDYICEFSSILVFDNLLYELELVKRGLKRNSSKLKKEISG